MNRKEVRSALAEKAGLSDRDAGAALDALQEIVTEAVEAGDKVVLPGFLSVEKVSRAARNGRNPQTGEPMEIPAGFGVKVSAGSALKNAASASNGTA